MCHPTSTYYRLNFSVLERVKTGIKREIEACRKARISFTLPIHSSFLALSLSLNLAVTRGVMFCAAGLSELCFFHTFASQSLRIRLPIRRKKTAVGRRSKNENRKTSTHHHLIHCTKPNSSETWGTRTKGFEVKESFVSP